jgi:N-acetylglucosamine-6-phosphate deacetylase
MGVAETIRERFLAARDYLRKWDEHRARRTRDPDDIPPRRDLQLETIAEILRGERLVHCHSYRQSELVMFLRLMEEMGVTIGTFQHVLDGYKVADEIARHGAGASTFSDWWAYKFEVYDAIPWNGALMWDRGVVVSFNSDSNEQARRLNTEAAKAVKYGGLPEEAALDLVTRNPAMQLRIDDRVGSLEPGKDADFVLWNGHPLAASSRVEETWIEGKKYFDRAVDLELRRELERERRALIVEAKGEPKGEGKAEAKGEARSEAETRR